jgi:D-psicose/D-tagatose/L-ribulose 3-epimerase
MKFGASTWLWTSPFTSDQISLLEKIADLGFDFVELPVESPEHFNVDILSGALQRLGLEAVICTAVTAERDLSAEDPAARAHAMKYFETCLQLADALGSSCVAGPLYAPVGKKRLATETQRQAEWQRSVDSLGELADKAGRYNIQLGLEPNQPF